jgi:lysophospholipase L1-like esterase
MSKSTSIVCFGDSITHCDGYAEADQWPVQLAFALEAWSPGAFAVFNRGIGGNTTALGLDRIQTDVIPHLPGLVLIEFGINDAYVNPWSSIPRTSLPGYRDNLMEIIGQIRHNDGKPVMIINHPVTTGMEFHLQGNKLPVGVNLEPYNEAARECARKAGVSFIDLPALLSARQVPMDSLWGDDQLHLSPAGNRLYADLIFQSLKDQNLLLRP